MLLCHPDKTALPPTSPRSQWRGRRTMGRSCCLSACCRPTLRRPSPGSETTPPSLLEVGSVHMQPGGQSVGSSVSRPFSSIQRCAPNISPLGVNFEVGLGRVLSSVASFFFCVWIFLGVLTWISPGKNWQFCFWFCVCVRACVRACVCVPCDFTSKHLILYQSTWKVKKNAIYLLWQNTTCKILGSAPFLALLTRIRKDPRQSDKYWNRF